MRPRVLALLLPVTAADYALWNWSVGGGHDVLALASGMTLLPLAALSVGLIGVALLQALAHSLRQSSTMAQHVRVAHSRPKRSARKSAQAATERATADSAGAIVDSDRAATHPAQAAAPAGSAGVDARSHSDKLAA